MPREEYFKQWEMFNNVENVKMKTENTKLVNNIEIADGSRDQLDWCVLRVNSGEEIQAWESRNTCAVGEWGKTMREVRGPTEEGSCRERQN